MKNIIKYIPKKLAALFLLLAMIIVPAAIWAASGPSRPTYTFSNAPTHVMFNSMTDNLNWQAWAGTGDERNFVAAVPAGTATDPNTLLGSNVKADTIAVEAGKEYYIAMLVHNDAYDKLNLVAENVRAKVTLPSGSGKSLSVRGDVSWSNTTPNPQGIYNVYDDVIFTSSENVTVSYVPGSAKYSTMKKTFTLSDNDLLGGGAKLGYETMDGKIPGCFEYHGIVFFKVKVNAVVVPPVKVPNFNLKKTVDKTTAGLKDTIKYTLEFTNTGELDLTNVIIKDQLPNELYWTNVSVSATLTEGIPAQSTFNKLFTSEGLKFGKVWVGGKITITITTVVDTSKIASSNCGKKLTLTNRSSATSDQKADETNLSDNNVNTELSVDCEGPKDPCPTDPKIEKNDPKCIPPCVYNPSIPSNDPKCLPPPTPCVYNPSIPANDPDCKAPGGGGDNNRPGPGGGTIIATGPRELIASLIATGALTFGVVAYVKSRKHLESIKNK